MITPEPVPRLSYLRGAPPCGPKKKSNPPGKPNWNDESGTVTLVLVFIFTTLEAAMVAMSAIVCSPSGVSPRRSGVGAVIGGIAVCVPGDGMLLVTFLPG